MNSHFLPSNPTSLEKSLEKYSYQTMLSFPRVKCGFNRYIVNNWIQYRNFTRDSVDQQLAPPSELRVCMPSTDGLKAMYFWKKLIFPFILLYSM